MDGVSKCLDSEAEARLVEFYKSNQARHGKTSGGGSFMGGTAATGGLAGMNEYADSIYSSAKEELIRKIAGDMNGMLGIKGSKQFATDGDINDIVKQMNESIDNKSVTKSKFYLHNR